MSMSLRMNVGPVSESESQSENGTPTLTPDPIGILPPFHTMLIRRVFARAIVRPPAYYADPPAQDAGLAGSVSGPPHIRLLGRTLACCCLLLGFTWVFLTAAKKDNRVLKILHTLPQSHEQSVTSR